MRGDLWHTCRFDFQDEGEKMQKRVLENEKMYELSLMKKMQQFPITDFFKLYFFSFQVFLILLNM